MGLAAACSSSCFAARCFVAPPWTVSHADCHKLLANAHVNRVKTAPLAQARTYVLLFRYAEEMGREALAAMGDRLGTVGAVLARDRTLPLVSDLACLFPEGGLRRGSTVVVGGTFPGATSLAMALLAGPCTGGSWCAVAGAPDLGLVAAAQLGIDLERLAVVPSPGAKWPVVTAALLEGFDVVLLCPPGPVRQPDARKLGARARERGSVLAVLGEGWPGPADIRLVVVAGGWRGLEDGCGYLWGREVEVIADGRGAASRSRRARIWLGPTEGPLFGRGGYPPSLGGSPRDLFGRSLPALVTGGAPEGPGDETAAGADLAG
jgi:hypothetical protein